MENELNEIVENAANMVHVTVPLNTTQRGYLAGCIKLACLEAQRLEIAGPKKSTDTEEVEA